MCEKIERTFYEGRRESGAIHYKIVAIERRSFSFGDCETHKIQKGLAKPRVRYPFESGEKSPKGMKGQK